MEPHIHVNAIRLIADRSRVLNKNTTFRPSEIDDVRSVITRISPFTETGFIISLDISEAFHSFCLDILLYAACQGLKKSPQT